MIDLLSMESFMECKIVRFCHRFLFSATGFLSATGFQPVLTSFDCHPDLQTVGATLALDEGVVGATLAVAHTGGI